MTHFSSKLTDRADRASYGGKRRRASIIIVVLVMMAFASMAMIVFMEKAANDTAVEIRAADAARMRLEAYSAMETVIGTLEDYRAALGALRSPAEGWHDPLGFAGYELASDDNFLKPRYHGLDPAYTVEVAFEDESGKLSLPNINATRLNSLFTYWGLDTDMSAKLTDALLGWMRRDYLPATAGAPQAEDYGSGDLPFTPPGRTLRSFDELASIDYVRDIFYDEAGRPNDLHRRFVAVFSLYDFPTTNINAATPDVLGALGSLDPEADEKLTEFTSGADTAAGGAPGWFASRTEIAQLLGDSPATALGVTISALRIIVTVRQNKASYRLNCLISVPPGGNGAKIPAGWSQLRPAGTTIGDSAAPGSASLASLSTSANASTSSVRGASQAAALGGGAATGNAAPVPVANLRYPYLYLEVRENDINPPPSPIISTETEQ
jgi:general secretion pathway protein K